MHGGRDVWRREPGPRRPWDEAQSPLATARPRECAWDGAGGAVLAATQASVLPVVQGMASGVAFCRSSKEVMRKGRTALAPCELSTTFAMAPVPANCWPDTPLLHGSFTAQDGSWGRAPGWVLGKPSQTCSVLGHQQHRNHIKRSMSPCQCWHRDIFWLSL